jgi:hypothetical protein
VVTAVARVSSGARLLALLLIAAVIPRLPSLGQPLVEDHPFRQTWTAWTAKLFHERGIDLLHPLVPIFGPQFVLPSEFPLFQALGALVMTAGVPTDPAMRVAGLLTFVGCAAALWLLARDVAGRAVAAIAVAIFAASPLALLWSRTSMIEYLALGAGLAYAWAGLRWRDGRGARWWWIALVLGLVTALVKPPTLVGCAIPLALAVAQRDAAGWRGWLRARLDPRFIALGALPLAAAFAWLAYGDAVKAADPATLFLQSSGPGWRLYYYETLADRVNAGEVDIVSGRLAGLAIGRFTLAFFALGIFASLRAARSSFWLGVALAVVLPIEIFWGAYRRHDYYFVAISAHVAMLSALGIVWAWRRMITRPARLALAAAAIVAVAGSLVAERAYWTVMYEPVHDPEQVLRGARVHAAATKPDEDVLVLGLGYDPSQPYYAGRRALMIAAENAAAVLPTLDRARYGTLYVRDPWVDPISITRAWRFVGARETSIYRISDRASGVADAYLVATDDPAPTAARVLADRPVTVPCDFNGVEVPAGERGTLLQLRPGYPVDARIALGFVSGPVPARGLVWLDGALTPGAVTVRVTCSGPGSLVIDRVLEAARPG